MSVSVNTLPGERPSFWDRRVVFFANLLSLFYGNKGGTDELTDAVEGIVTYGGRLIPILDLLYAGDRSEPPNLLVLEREPAACLLDYFRDRLGLSLPELTTLCETRYGDLVEFLENGRPSGAAAK